MMRRTSEILDELERELREEDGILDALEHELSAEEAVLHRLEADFAELRQTLTEPPTGVPRSDRMQAFTTVLVVAFVALAAFMVGWSVENTGTTADLSAQLAASQAKVADLVPLVNSAYSPSDLATDFREAAGWRVPVAASAFDSVEAFQTWLSGLSIPALTVWATGGGPPPPSG